MAAAAILDFANIAITSPRIERFGSIFLRIDTKYDGESDLVTKNSI